MSILLSAIFIFHGLILLLETETSEQHRCLVIIVIIPNIWFMVFKMTGFNPVFQHENQFWKIFTKSWDIGKKSSGLFRDLCYKQQSKTTKNENGAQKNVHIFKSNTPTLLKLSVGFHHMYTKGRIFLDPAV